MMKLKLGFVALLLMATIACIHKVGGGQITPWERVHADNALFAQGNNALLQGVIVVQTSGLISVNQAEPVVRLSGKTAELHKQVTAILAKGPDVTPTDLATIKALVDQIETSATEAIRTGAFGVKNPKSQQTIEADIKGLAALARVLLTDIQSVINARTPQAVINGMSTGRVA